MALTELIAGVENHEKTLTVFNADPEATTALREHFADRNLVVTESDAPGGPDRFVVLHRDGEFVTAAGVDDILRPRAETDPSFDADAYRPILDHLDETMFTSYDTRQMVAASREIEDRAWRTGRGELHAGFQKLSVVQSQRDVYDQLGGREDLDVHVYGYPDTDPPTGAPFTVHLERATEIQRSWFVVYDGAGVDVNKCALLAEERDERSFYGFWTYDPDTVDWIVEYLEQSYGLVESR